MSPSQPPFGSESELAEAFGFLRAVVGRAMGTGLRRNEAPSDIVQSAFREFLELARSGTVPATLAPPERRGFLARLALRKIVDRARYHGVRSRHRRRLKAEAADAAGSNELDPARVQQWKERIERLQAAMELLPSDHREVIVLSYFEQLPHLEIASRMGRTVDASKMLLSRAVAQLARLLGPAT